jgi:hypothetical protein
MLEPFKRENGFIVPVANDDSDWFFNEPSVARREYQGELLLFSPENGYYEGWKYQSRTIGPDGWTWDWAPIYPKVGFFGQLKQVLTRQWAAVNSPYKYVQKFEDAELLFTEDYDYGEYWLMLDEEYLIPVDHAEQLSDINILEIHTLSSVEDTFYALQKAMEPMKNHVYGVIFTHESSRARIRLSDFDWSNK